MAQAASARVPVGSAVTVRNEHPASGVSWAAIIAGGVTAAAVSLILLLLGSFFGFAAFSPWPDTGASIAAFGAGAAIWLVVVQWVASGLGGYMAGRLRTKWVGVHTDEVFFRDTAHGFLAWAIGTLFVVALVVMSVTSAVRTGVEAASNVAGGAAQGAIAAAGDATSYFTDSLFRAPADAALPAAGDGASADVRAEAGRILARGLAAGELSDEDEAYLDRLVAAQTGLPANEAEARVNEVVGAAQDAEAAVRQAADDAADVAATMAIYTFLSMLVGAFIAAVAAALGGRQRDDIEIRTAPP